MRISDWSSDVCSSDLDELAAMPATRIADERAGVDMLYSSGTTGRPKGVRVPLPEEPAIAASNSLVMLAAAAFAIGPDSVYLSPAPLYHAAPDRKTVGAGKRVAVLVYLGGRRII